MNDRKKEREREREKDCQMKRDSHKKRKRGMDVVVEEIWKKEINGSR